MYNPLTAVAGIAMLALLIATFTAMTRYKAPQALAMPLLACAFLVIQGTSAGEILRIGFGHFSAIAILFTAVAIPAHMIDRSLGFQWFAARAGGALGHVTLHYSKLALPSMITAVLITTYVLAAFLHNVTSILIMAPIVIRLCMKYGIQSRWILSGTLVASNLGGFTTRWGDTPNIVEAQTFGLTNHDFTFQVLPANLVVLLFLIFVVIMLTRRSSVSDSTPSDSMHRDLSLALKASEYAREMIDMVVDKRLLILGLAVLAGFIVLQAAFPGFQIAIGAATICLAILLERKKERLGTLKSLGYDVYLIFAAVFVLAACVEHSWIGMVLQKVIQGTHAAPWAIALTGTLGTISTEAASWATVAAARIFPLDSSHTAAWALGSGICAGSSAIVTAASAGIILCEESRKFQDPKHEITFRNYLVFGLPIALFMLLFYICYFSIFRY